MSDIGLNTNIYEAAKKHLDILNEFLLIHKLNVSDTNLKINEDVASFIEMLIDESIKDPHLQMLHVLVDRSLRLKNQSLKIITNNVADSLRNNNSNEDIVHQIEIIAKILDSECLQAIGRTRGTKR